jgi:hypothetical protein
MPFSVVQLSTEGGVDSFLSPDADTEARGTRAVQRGISRFRPIFQEDLEICFSRARTGFQQTKGKNTNQRTLPRRWTFSNILTTYEGPRNSIPESTKPSLCQKRKATRR